MIIIDDKNLKKDTLNIPSEYKNHKYISDPNAKRRCPYCQSDKWIWIKTLPIPQEILGLFLNQLFQCGKCGKKFFATRRAQATLVKSVNKCPTCNSTYIEKVSKPNADIELYQCKKCLSYLGIK